MKYTFRINRAENRRARREGGGRGRFKSLMAQREHVSSFGRVTKFGKMFFSTNKIVFSQVCFSVEEQAAVQRALQERLGPEYISQRAGAGGQKVWVP